MARKHKKKYTPPPKKTVMCTRTNHYTSSKVYLILNVNVAITD